MKVIYKYPLKLKDTQVLELFIDYKILSVGEQDGQLVLWAIVDPNRNRDTAQIEIRGTGHTINEPDELFEWWDFIGTVQQSNGLVWHIFDNKAPF